MFECDAVRHSPLAVVLGRFCFLQVGGGSGCVVGGEALRCVLGGALSVGGAAGLITEGGRKRCGEGRSVDLGGRRIRQRGKTGSRTRLGPQSEKK